MDKNTNYNPGGTCKNCNFRYSRIQREHTVTNGKTYPVDIYRCKCATHYVHPNGDIDTRLKGSPCKRCSFYFRVVKKEGEDGYTVKFCACGLNCYFHNGEHVFIVASEVVKLPKALLELDKDMLDAMSEKKQVVASLIPSA